MNRGVRVGSIFSKEKYIPLPRLFGSRRMAEYQFLIVYSHKKFDVDKLFYIVMKFDTYFDRAPTIILRN